MKLYLKDQHERFGKELKSHVLWEFMTPQTADKAITVYLNAAAVTSVKREQVRERVINGYQSINSLDDITL